MPIPSAITRAWIAAGELVHRPLSVVTRAADRLSRVPRLDPGEPDLARPVSQVATEAQCVSPLFDRWRAALGLPLDEHSRFDRKIWEWVYILQALEVRGMLGAGISGLGFGVGREPLAALMASRGCTIVATDLPSEASETAEWTGTGQHASQLADLNAAGLCPPEEFAKRVRFQSMDMRAIDPSLRGFDFTWSSCALEHLGNLQRGIDFIFASLETLRPGGVAVHTTEYNVASNSLTLPRGSVVLYRRRDVVALADRLRRAGHRVELNLHTGSGDLDRYVDRPPFREGKAHLKLLVGPFVATSLGIWIEKDAGASQNSAGS